MRGRRVERAGGYVDRVGDGERVVRRLPGLDDGEHRPDFFLRDAGLRRTSAMTVGRININLRRPTHCRRLQRCATRADFDVLVDLLKSVLLRTGPVKYPRL